jgi:hypothetical protein
MRLALTALTALALTLPSPVRGQAIAQVMSGIRDGGGWIGIPIVKGHGTFSTVTLPTAAMSLSGCVNVWYGHSGTWTIEAHERVLGSRLQIEAEPGVGVPFEHDFGMTAQVDFDFRWSEPRDTTLMLWVGLEGRGQTDRDPCDPW